MKMIRTIPHYATEDPIQFNRVVSSISYSLQAKNKPIDIYRLRTRFFYFFSWLKMKLWVFFLIFDQRAELYELKNMGGGCWKVLRIALRKRKTSKEKERKRAQLRCSIVNQARLTKFALRGSLLSYLHVFNLWYTCMVFSIELILDERIVISNDFLLSQLAS